MIDNIKKCSKCLALWGDEIFGLVQKNLAMARTQLKNLERNDMTQKFVEIQGANREVQKWLEAEEIMWRQHSKVL